VSTKFSALNSGENIQPILKTGNSKPTLYCTFKKKTAAEIALKTSIQALGN
jgi:hypothetical protein